METAGRGAIIALFEDLCSNTTDTLIISHLLYSSDFLTSAEFDQIKAKASPDLKNEQLYATLLTKSGNVMDYILQALRETFNHDLATRLESEIESKQASAVTQAKPVAKVSVDISKVLRPILKFLCENTENITKLALLLTDKYISTFSYEEIEYRSTQIQRAYTLYKVIMKKNIPIEELYDFLTQTKNHHIVTRIKKQLTLQNSQ